MSAGAPEIRIYTDGACSGNPGPGGYGAVLVSGTHRKELAKGFRKTTNNRMELLAVIEGPEDTWQVVRTMMGATNPRTAAPGTIRGDLGIEFTENLIHGSDSAESAAREIALFFPA